MFQRTIWFLSTQATAKHRVFPFGAVSSSPAPPHHPSPHSSAPCLPPSPLPVVALPLHHDAGITGDHGHPSEGTAEERGRCVMPPTTRLHPCTHTHRRITSLVTDARGMTLKGRRIPDWRRSGCSAHHVSPAHTCA